MDSISQIHENSRQDVSWDTMINYVDAHSKNYSLHTEHENSVLALLNYATLTFLFKYLMFEQVFES